MFLFERIISAKSQHSSRWPDHIVVPEQMVPSCRYKWPVLVSIWYAFIYSWSAKAIFRWVSHFLSPFVVINEQSPLPPSMPVLTSLTLRTGHGEIHGIHIWMHKDTQHKLFWGYQVAHNWSPMCLFSLSFEHQRSGDVNITFGSPLAGMRELKRTGHFHSSSGIISVYLSVVSLARMRRCRSSQ